MGFLWGNDENVLKLILVTFAENFNKWTKKFFEIFSDLFLNETVVFFPKSEWIMGLEISSQNISIISL